MPQLLLSLLALLTVLLPGGAWAQAPEDPFRAEIAPVSVPAGGQGTLEVRMQMPAEHHLYRDSMEVRLDDPQGFSLGEPDFPVGRLEPDPAFPERKREAYYESFTLPVPITAGADLAVGAHELEVQVRYQGCKGNLCFLPNERAIPLTVTVTASEGPTGEPDLAAFGARPDLDDQDPVGVRAVGGDGELRVAFFQAEGWHVNRNMTWIELDEGSALTAGEALFPEAHAFTDPVSGMERLEIAGDFVATLPVQGPAGSQRAALAVGFQACKADLCLMPRTEHFELDVTIPGAAPAHEPAATAQAAPTGGDGQGDTFQRMREKGLVWLVLFVFGAGFLVSLTPCVLPMIPITMGIIGVSAAGNRFKAITLSLTYVAGMALVYTALGVFAALTGSLFGFLMTSPWVVGAIAIFFAAMGLAMFGLFDVAMPSGVTTRLNQLGGSGYKGALVVGMVGAIVAGPCSGPVIASLMVAIGAGGEILLGVFLMLAFSLGMGMLFLGVGIFSGMLLRPGAWMETVKHIFGVLLLFAAIYFGHAHMPDWLPAVLAMIVLLVTAAFAWPTDESGGRWMTGLYRLYALVAAIVGAWLLFAILTMALLAPRLNLDTLVTGDASTAQAPHITWQQDETAAMAQARAENKPVVIDFGAEWCAACKELEHITYTDPRVVEAAAGFIPVMIDSTDAKDPAIKALQKKYEVKGLPTVVFVLPDGTTMDDLTVTGFVNADDFLARMTEARARVE